MALLQYLFVHCAYTKPSFVLTPDHILTWHTGPKPKYNGWDRAGYTDIFLRDGTLHNLVPFDQDNEVDYNEMTWGVKGVNGISRHICLEGGKDLDGNDANPLNTFPAMVGPLLVYINYTILRHPQIKIAGHYQFDSKKYYCPGINNLPQWLKSMGIPEENIHF